MGNPAPWVYISGPLSTGGLMAGNARRAMEWWEKLWRIGVHPICPHWSLLQEFVQEHPWEEWLAYDETIITRCDALLRIPGESRGADREVGFAVGLGKPVFFASPSVLGSLERWKGQWRPSNV